MRNNLALKRNEILSHDTFGKIKDLLGEINQKCISDSTYMRYLQQSNSETENRTVIARGWGKGGLEAINRYSVSAGKDEESHT